MHLAQILLPLADNEGNPLPGSLYNAVFRTLTQRFGGATAYTRAPAEGAWQEPAADPASGPRVNRDQVVIFEVMVARLEHDWWAAYRRQLEAEFKQEKVLIRAIVVEEL